MGGTSIILTIFKIVVDNRLSIEYSIWTVIVPCGVLTMKRKEIQAKYNKVLSRLHTCRPCEKDMLKVLLNYYYNQLH